MKMSEYDAFGPWTYKVDEDHEIPRYFREYVDENDNALFRLKIPRKIDRRDATPDMDLYEYLINVYEDRLVLMQLADGGIRMQKASYDKVCAVSMFKDLLLGRLYLYKDDGDVLSFDYNAVTESENLVTEVVEVVRKGMIGSYTSGDAEDFDINSIQPSDIYFVNMLNGIKQQGTKFVNCAIQDVRYLSVNQETGPVVGSLHMKTATEWIILKKRNKYAQEFIYIPRHRSIDTTFGGSAPHAGVVKMTLKVGSFSTDLLYDDDNAALVEHYK